MRRKRPQPTPTDDLGAGDAVGDVENAIYARGVNDRGARIRPLQGYRVENVQVTTGVVLFDCTGQREAVMTGWQVNNVTAGNGIG